ncbi:sigma factor-like helix-turn-helix DNA-binding protein [Actinophytocola sp.]|uniref:sigma-70 region 4 domain-containing protein n=1 Tax=Actinophytocola sp. TaxID=1872138 RepID=UPI0039C88B10
MGAVPRPVPPACAARRHGRGAAHRPHVGPARQTEPTEILDAIRMLPQRLRDPLLFRMAGFSHKEIACFRACSVDTARQRICRARRVLSTWLGTEPAASLSATTRRRAR